MSLNLLLDPNSTGEVFISTHDAIEGKIVPTTLLSSSHPFHEFWKTHLAALQRPGLYDTVIDALVALTQRDASWRRRRSADAIVGMRREMRELFRQHPPSIVVVSGLGNAYGFHLRDPLFWPFIHVSEEYINLWIDADKSSEKGLALTVLITAAIDHAIGHWMFTLKAGYFSSEQPNELEGAPSGSSNLTLPIENNKKKCTLKKLGVEWKADSGEAGEFVETRSRGGIIGYVKEVHRAYIKTEGRDEDVHFLPLSYLQTCFEETPVTRPSLRFIPPGPSSPSTKMKTTSSFFPRIADSCAQLSSSSFQSATGSHDVFYRPHCESRIRFGKIIRELIKQRRLELKREQA